VVVREWIKVDRSSGHAYDGRVMSGTKTGRWRRLLPVPLLLLLAAGGGWLLAPGSGAVYLQLQARSDALHRGAVLAEPILAVSFVLLGLLALVFADFPWPRRILAGLTLASLAAGLGLGAYVLHFDLTIEEAGSAGQFTSARPAKISGQQRWAGPWQESDGPGIASPPRDDGHLVELDRISLTLKDADGRRIWNRRRPGGWPASLLLGERHLLLALPSDRWEDDVLLQLVELDSGRLVSEFHVLGRRISIPLARGPRVVLATWRPSGTALYVLDLAGPRLLWRRRPAERTQWPPRRWPEELQQLLEGKPP